MKKEQKKQIKEVLDDYIADDLPIDKERILSDVCDIVEDIIEEVSSER